MTMTIQTQTCSATARPNYDLRDEIRDYWSDRAAGFDRDPGHRIAAGAERRAWSGLIARHPGPAEGRRLLDLACGTAEISLLCHDLGFRVTGLDWAGPMLDRARAKAAAAGAAIPFVRADAERTTLPDACMEVLACRHLVWTLVDPAAAFAEWFRVLAPGGRLLVVDGDFVSRGWIGRWLARMAGPARPDRGGELAARHVAILSRVHFAQGARAGAVAALLAGAGFADIRIDTAFGPIHRAQARALGWRRSLMRRSEHRYAICAVKPG